MNGNESGKDKKGKKGGRTDGGQDGGEGTTPDGMGTMDSNDTT